MVLKVSVAQIIEKLKSLVAKSPVASKEPVVEVSSSGGSSKSVVSVGVSLPSKSSVSAPELRRKVVSREQAVNRLLALVRAAVDAVVSGDKSRLETIVKEVKALYNTLKLMNGKDFADSVFSEAYSRLDGVGKEVLSAMLSGGVNAVLGKREGIVAEYVSSVLKRAGVPVTPKEVHDVVVKTKLDVKKLADEIKDNMKKVLEWSRRPKAGGMDMKKAVAEMRAAIAVALGVGGAEALRMFQRSFKGSERQVFDFMAKSALKPVKNEELIKRLNSMISKGEASSKSMKEVISAKSKIVMGEGSGGEGGEGSSDEAEEGKAFGEVAKARMAKIMEGMKRRG